MYKIIEEQIIKYTFIKYKKNVKEVPISIIFKFLNT